MPAVVADASQSAVQAPAVPKPQLAPAEPVAAKKAEKLLPAAEAKPVAKPVLVSVKTMEAEDVPAVLTDTAAKPAKPVAAPVSLATSVPETVSAPLPPEKSAA